MTVAEKSELLEKIDNALESVRPHLRVDGGDIEVVKLFIGGRPTQAQFEQGVVDRGFIANRRHGEGEKQAVADLFIGKFHFLIKVSPR